MFLIQSLESQLKFRDRERYREAHLYLGPDLYKRTGSYGRFNNTVNIPLSLGSISNYGFES